MLTDFTSIWLVYFRLQNATASVVGLGHTAQVLCACAERVPKPVDSEWSVEQVGERPRKQGSRTDARNPLQEQENPLLSTGTLSATIIAEDSVVAGVDG